MTGWHRWLGTNETGRAIGRGITGACNLAFLFLVVSGFYLWWPRNWSWNTFRPLLWFVRGQSGKARNWNWHNTIGFWCAPILFFIVLTGVIMSYPWANNLLYKLTRSELPPQRAGTNARGGRAPGTPTEIQTDGLNDIWAVAEKKVSGWNYISLRFPQKPGGPLTFLIDRGNGARLTCARRSRWTPTVAKKSAGNLMPVKAPGKRRVHGHASSIPAKRGGIDRPDCRASCDGGRCDAAWTGLAMALRRFVFRNKINPTEL